MTSNAEKCHVAVEEVYFLSMKLTAAGIVEAVLNFKTPSNLTVVRSLLGLIVTFGAKFVWSLADVALPLRRLTKKANFGRGDPRDASLQRHQRRNSRKSSKSSKSNKSSIKAGQDGQMSSSINPDRPLGYL